jgi:putative tryptophan/tyrosine transport system substrate-binding protein
VGRLGNPPLYKAVDAAAHLINLSTVPIVAQAPSDLQAAFEQMSKIHCDAVFVLADPIRATIVTLANSFRIPAFYQFREFVDAGGLVSYGPNVGAMFRRSAQYVDKIFKGANAADLPVEQPTKFDLVINLKTAKALGLTVPPPLLATADEVIE